MRPVRTAWFPVLFPLFVTLGCSSSTELSREIYNPEVQFQRAVYANMYPASPHLEAVNSGTIVAGMDTTAVAAAWGTPQVRDEKKIDATEWVYFEIDPYSHDPVDYVLVFNAGVLSSWDTRVHDSLGGSRDIVFEHWLNRSRVEAQYSKGLGNQTRVPYSPKPKQEKKEENKKKK